MDVRCLHFLFALCSGSRSSPHGLNSPQWTCKMSHVDFMSSCPATISISRPSKCYVMCVVAKNSLRGFFAPHCSGAPMWEALVDAFFKTDFRAALTHAAALGGRWQVYSVGLWRTRSRYCPVHPSNTFKCRLELEPSLFVTMGGPTVTQGGTHMHLYAHTHTHT